MYPNLINSHYLHYEVGVSFQGFYSELRHYLANIEIRCCGLAICTSKIKIAKNTLAVQYDSGQILRFGVSNNAGGKGGKPCHWPTRRIIKQLITKTLQINKMQINNCQKLMWKIKKLQYTSITNKPGIIIYFLRSKIWYTFVFFLSENMIYSFTILINSNNFIYETVTNIQ